MIQTEDCKVLYLFKRDKVKSYKHNDEPNKTHFNVNIIQHFRDSDIVIYKTEKDEMVVMKSIF